MVRSARYLTVAAAIALPLFAASCGSRREAAPDFPATGLDHILVGAPDLDAAVASVARQTGVRPTPGGSHPGVGTRNALLSLGSGAYLEIIAPDPAQKSGDFGKFVASLKSMTPLGWALHTDDIDRLHSALAARGVRVEPIVSGSRVRPDGRTLRWRNFEIGPEEDVSPFFIQWDRGSPHPSTDAPKGCHVEQLVRGGGTMKPNAVKALQLVGQAAVLHSTAPDGLHFTLGCLGGSMRF
ncbi:MAG: VOC family protein [Bacillota bacterium]